MTRRSEEEIAGKPEASTHSRPITPLRLGRSQAAVWQNTAEKRKFSNVSFSRSYLDEEKRFHDANSFGRDDLLLVAKLADEALTYIFKRLSSKKTEAAP